jgi:hypothetical protein
MSLAETTSFREAASALQQLDAWIEKERFLGWDPHDALNSPLLQGIAGRNRLIGMALVQSLRHNPVNLRPLLGVQKGYNPKAMGLFLSSYAQKFLDARDERHLERVRFFSDWLVKQAVRGYAGLCWGYNFDWPNRGFFAPAGTPTIVNTAFIALSFLDAEPALECLAELPQPEIREGAEARPENAPWRRADAVRVARSACDFILRDLQVLRPSSGEICFSYTPLDRRFVHNANLMGACLLAAVHARTGENHLGELARAAARFTVRKQEGDGSWPYGIGKRDRWVDHFHTGFVLVALKRISRYLQTAEFDAVTRRGYQFWKERMFLPGPVPKYYPHRTYPIDIHCVAQAILTLLEFSDADAEARDHADRVCRWAIENLQDPQGFFHFQIRRWYRIRTPYMRWGQAWMQRALTEMVHGGRVSDSRDVAWASK